MGTLMCYHRTGGNPAFTAIPGLTDSTDVDFDDHGFDGASGSMDVCYDPLYGTGISYSESQAL
jgi:hypothetical protein